jgi:Na+-transporting methylmalonyl-CoA/oxaloacetate decarboxylase beta subunit
LAPDLLGAIAVASYSYMALVPLIQPPIMRALTTQKERQIKMVQLREVSTAEKIIFPVMLLMLVALLLPDAAPLLGMFAFGNLMKESGVVDRLSDTTQNALINEPISGLILFLPKAFINFAINNPHAVPIAKATIPSTKIPSVSGCKNLSAINYAGFNHPKRASN